jgi:hypothetical protein
VNEESRQTGSDNSDSGALPGALNIFHVAHGDDHTSLRNHRVIRRINDQVCSTRARIFQSEN